MAVPAERVRAANAAPVCRERSFVLYWMTATRRVRWNPALERASLLARELGRPLVVLEALRCGYPYASDRLHAFVMQGMADNARRLRGRALHHAWIERSPGQGKGLLEALAARACAVVTDDFPTFFLPRLLASAAARLDVRVEAVDGSCLVPFRLAGRDFPTAYAYRRFLQKALPAWLDRLPAEDPLALAPVAPPPSLPPEVTRRWPATDPDDLARPARLLAALPIDHRVPPAPLPGGTTAAGSRLAEWLAAGLPRYADARNDPDAEGVASGLSPWLHFGHLSTFEIVRAIAAREGWTPALLAPRAAGQREGFWGLPPPAEVFLDQLVTWRELGFVTCAQRVDHRDYESLPAWAKATLEAHAADPRPVRYAYEDLAAARTGDPLWNAAQRQLLAEGRIHGYLRMLWGKRVLEWTGSPREALEILLDLNDRYALDGRDPNSVSGVFWCLGRYDRPWPERPVFGTVRAMSSARTARKVAVEHYLERFAGPSGGQADRFGGPAGRA
jgi:deoxyribodipyrimidine photo-lyase